MKSHIGSHATFGAALSVFALACNHAVIVEDDEPGGDGGPVGGPSGPHATHPAVHCGEAEQAPAFTVGSFDVTYYSEDEYRGEDTVAQPSIRYPYESYLGIDSYGFYATWDGTLEVHDPNATIAANFDVSWSDVTFVVDGQPTAAWSDSSQTIPLPLSPGVHAIEVTHRNHWHTTGFNASFTDYPIAPLSHSVATAQPYIDGNTKVAYVGAYESAALHNEVTVQMDASASPVLLVLHSYSAIRWQISASSCIAAVVVSSFAPGSTVTGVGSRPVVAVDGWIESEGASAATALVGQQPDHASYEYALTNAVVPSFD